MQALPLLIDKLAASIVTLGRLSNTIPNTPKGTRICPTRIPLGCWRKPATSPITSGIAASCSHPKAQVSNTLGLSLSRSTMGADKPAAVARSISLAFSICKAATLSRSKAAKVRSAAFFVAAEALAIDAHAALAWTPKVWV